LKDKDLLVVLPRLKPGFRVSGGSRYLFGTEVLIKYFGTEVLTSANGYTW
jgi:hypothetical protein